MQLSVLLSNFLVLSSALPTHVDDFANIFQDGQEPIIEDCPPITLTKVVTRTSHEINVVSTVYRTRTQGAHANPTPHVNFEPEKQRFIFGVEGSGCDRKACTICRMLSNCSDEERDCTSCDLAYYCNQCPPTRLLSAVELEGIRIQKTCSLRPGRTISCDEVDETIAKHNELLPSDKRWNVQC